MMCVFTTVCSAVFWVTTLLLPMSTIYAEQRMSTQTSGNEKQHHHQHHSHHHPHQHFQHSTNGKLRQVERLLARHKPMPLRSDTSLASARYVQNHYETWPDRWPSIIDRPKNAIVDKFERQDDDYAELPPYVRKYLRRNRKLIESLERGASDTSERDVFITAMRARQQEPRQNENINWMQANLFEQQKSRKITVAEAERNKQQQPNELPESSVQNIVRKKTNDSVKLGNKNLLPDGAERVSTTVTGKAATATVRSNATKDRVNNFRFHRIATPQLIGAGSHGLIAKQILPFVAITDRRLSSPLSSSSLSSLSSSSTKLTAPASLTDVDANNKRK